MAQPMALKAPLGGAGREVAARWQRFAPRERSIIAIAAVLVGILVVWLLFIQPAWRTIRAAPAQLEALDNQLQHMRSLAMEARDLRSAAPVSMSQAVLALNAATQRLGTRASLSVVGERATVTLNNVAGGEMTAWLSEARTAARARPVEAQLTRGPQGYSGTIALALGGRTS
jgi:general secretion pathway protein M